MYEDDVATLVTNVEADGEILENGLGRMVSIHLPSDIQVYGRNDLKRLRASQRDGSGNVKPEVLEELAKYEACERARIASEDFPIRYASGGSVPVLENASNGIEYMMFVHRSGKNPRLSALAGHSVSREDGLRELLDPRYLIERETIEEGLIQWRGRAVLPGFGSEDRALLQRAKILAEKVREVDGYSIGLKKVLQAIETTALKNYNLDSVNVWQASRNGLSIRTSGFDTNAIWVPEMAALELISVPRVSRLEVNELRIYDMEFHNDKPLKRDFVLVPVHVLQGKRNRDEWLNKCLVMNGYEVEGVNETKDLEDFRIGTTASKLLKRLFDYSRD